MVDMEHGNLARKDEKRRGRDGKPDTCGCTLGSDFDMG